MPFNNDLLYKMTIEQLIDNRAKYRTVWVKRGDTIVKRDLMDVSEIKPVNTIVPVVKENK